MHGFLGFWTFFIKSLTLVAILNSGRLGGGLISDICTI